MMTLKLPDIYHVESPPAPFSVQEIVVVLLATLYPVLVHEKFRYRPL